jgi:hypothetical protein
MADSEYVARIRAYLEEHRQTYDQAALRAKLLTDGHPESVVDLALAQVYGYDPPPATPAPPQRNGPPLWLTIVLTFFGTYIVLALLFGAAIDSSNGFVTLSPLLLLPLQIIAMLVVRRRHRQLARGLAWGIAAAWAPLFSLVLLVGICLAVLGYA